MPVMISLIWGDLATDRLLLTMWLNRHWVLTILIHHQFSRNLVTERGNTVIFDHFYNLWSSEVFYSNISSSRESSRAGTYSKKVTYEVGSTVLPSSIMKPIKPPTEENSKGLSSNWKIFLQYIFFNFRILERWRSWNRRGDPKEWTWRYNSNHLLCLNNDCTTDTYPTECRYLLEIE